MAEELTLNFTVPSDDFTRAGEASSATKSTLKQLGLPGGHHPPGVHRHV